MNYAEHRMHVRTGSSSIFFPTLFGVGNYFAVIRIRESPLEVPNTVNLDSSAVVSNSHQLLYRFLVLKPEPNEGCTRKRNHDGRFDRLHAREPGTHYCVRIGLAPACTPS